MIKTLLFIGLLSLSLHAIDIEKKKKECTRKSGCSNTQYCKRGKCLKKKANHEKCLWDSECETNDCQLDDCTVAVVIPQKFCRAKKNSVGYGGKCQFRSECKAGLICPHTPKEGKGKHCYGVCTCNQDKDCGNGKYCHRTLLGSVNINAHDNVCKPKKKNGEKCKIAFQKSCASGNCKVCGAGARCYKAKSVNFGGTCNFNAECKKGKCSGAMCIAGKCVCKKDSDCGSGQYCYKGVGGIGKNKCKGKKKKGKSCTKNKHCKSNKCKWFKCK